jgi:4-hydroxy-3-methylbut-2-en-1-yl diphosphate reductase
MKKFDVPPIYRSSIISGIKTARKIEDPRKQDYSPTVLDFGPVEFLIARHFGFCYGVENAIEIAYKTIELNPGKRIFLLSEIIHNPQVNLDLQSQGIQFIMDNYGHQLIKWDEINSDDIVIIPAFGTTIDIEKLLHVKSIDTVKYNTTCPFVEKVWNRAASLGNENFTVVIHGKALHEETRATFSHSVQQSKAVIVRNTEETAFLSKIILGEIPSEEFYNYFDGKYSAGFNVEKDLQRIGVVNQTTMLASETQAISDLLNKTMIKKFGEENINQHFADTRDTLCYATNDNQSATLALMKENADLAIVIGGYNSSNTSHLVELLEKSFNTYFISDADKIISDYLVQHFDLHTRKEIVTEAWLPRKEKVSIAVTSGASCPDRIVDETLNKIISYFSNAKPIVDVLKSQKGSLPG